MERGVCICPRLVGRRFVTGSHDPSLDAGASSGSNPGGKLIFPGATGHGSDRLAAIWRNL